MSSSAQRPSAAARSTQHDSRSPRHDRSTQHESRSYNGHRPSTGRGAGGQGAPPARSGNSGGRSRGYAPRKDRPVRSRPAKARGPFDDIPMTVIDTDNMPTFLELGLPAGLGQALVKSGITIPFPIQAATIPDAMTGRDVLGRAATGSGKTLAFGLPMIARLEGGRSAARRPRGLVLVPTRELAMQVTDALAPLAQARGLSLRLVAGGLPIYKQIQGMTRGTDIVVATPGRLVDLLERKACDLSDVQVTVLDEADHMADLGFLPVVRQLLNLTPQNGQRLLFSATLDGDVATLVTEYLTDPAIKALSTPQAAVDTMDHHVFRVPAAMKWQLVNEIAAREGRTILFVRTKFGAERLADNLNRAGVASSALHGGRTQAQRTKALNRFKDGSISTLVATDVAARGIHVDDISLVLHVDPPADEKDYLHRSGRTARAGESGMVVTVVTPNEERTVRNLMLAAGVRPNQRDAHPGDPEVSELTGARLPSGVPIIEQKPPARPARSQSGYNGANGGNRGQRQRPGRPRFENDRRPGAGNRSRPSGSTGTARQESRDRM